MANVMPIDNIDGNAGGTVIVIRSNDFTMIIYVVVPLSMRAGNRKRKPRIATRAIIPINIIES